MKRARDDRAQRLTANPAVRGDRSVTTCASLDLLLHVAEHGVAVRGRREPPEQPDP
jgi:hypothetical protein